MKLRRRQFLLHLAAGRGCPRDSAAHRVEARPSLGNLQGCVFQTPSLRRSPSREGGNLRSALGGEYSTVRRRKPRAGGSRASESLRDSLRVWSGD
jgi:hypothetical protein